MERYQRSSNDIQVCSHPVVVIMAMLLTLTVLGKLVTTSEYR